MRARRLRRLALVMALAACAAPRDEPGRAPADSLPRPAGDRAELPGATTVAALVDSVPYRNELTDGVLRRVEVRRAGRVDTVPDVLTADTPIVVGDSMVIGVRASENLVAGLFAYDVRTRTTRAIASPDGMVPHATPAVSPDGRHVAFLAQREDGKGYGAVATVPARRIIYRGPPATMLETDAGVDGVRWTSADRFEIRIELSYRTGGAQRIRGSVSSASAVVDTIRNTTSSGGDAR